MGTQYHWRGEIMQNIERVHDIGGGNMAWGPPPLYETYPIHHRYSGINGLVCVRILT